MKALLSSIVATAAMVSGGQAHAQAAAPPPAAPVPTATVYQTVDVPPNKSVTIQYMRSSDPASVVSIYTRNTMADDWVRKASLSTVKGAQKATIVGLPSNSSGFQVRADAVIDPGNGVLAPMGKVTTSNGANGTVFGYYQYAAHGDEPNTEIDVNLQ